MLKKCGVVVFFLLLLVLPAASKTTEPEPGAVVENHFYSPDGCPIIITDLQSHWQEFRPTKADFWGKIKQGQLPGIWCKCTFSLPDERHDGKEILGIKFGLWYFNAFDELLGVYIAYAAGGGKEIYQPGQEYSQEWLTNQDDNLGATHCRTILFPYQVRFKDRTSWVADFQPIFEWFTENLEWGKDFKYEDLFPEKVFGGKEEKEETA